MHESYKKWLDDGKPKIFCGCGCGVEIIIKQYRKHRGIPKFIRGHQGRIYSIPESYKKWEEQGKPQMFCACGCGKEIIVKDCHRWAERGIPKCIYGHTINKGENFYFYGKHHSEEMKEKLSQIRKERISNGLIKVWNKGLNKENNESVRKISESKMGENNPCWNGGITNKPYCEKWNEILREKIRNQYGKKMLFMWNRRKR